MKENIYQLVEGNRIWLGGTNTNSDGEWRWAHIENPITYNGWRNNVPDEPERCMTMLLSHVWNDIMCRNTRAFVCEYEI